MSTAIFLRLLRDEDKARALAEAIAALREGRRLESTTYPVLPVSFRQVPGSPFTYWVSERIRRLFTELPAFEGDGRTVRQGLATADDFHFIRAWWEIPSERILDGANGPDWQEEFPAFQAWCRQRTFEGKRWVPFAKGGEYSPYYADLHLVVQWEQDGGAVKEFVVTLPGTTHWSRRVASDSYYFHPGLTFPRRTRRFCPKILPSGAIFGHGGQSGFCDHDLPAYVAILGSKVCQFVITLFLGTSPQDWGGTNPQFETGIIKLISMPSMARDVRFMLQKQLTAYERTKQSFDTYEETSYIFCLPILLQVLTDTLESRSAAWQIWTAKTEPNLGEYARQIEDIAFLLYGIDGVERLAIDVGFKAPGVGEGEEAGSEVEEELEPQALYADQQSLVADLMSYIVGCVFGRWDVRLATGARQPPELPDPCAPLPICSPGMLTGEDGLPLRAAPPGYPPPH